MGFLFVWLIFAISETVSLASEKLRYIIMLRVQQKGEYYGKKQRKYAIKAKCKAYLHHWFCFLWHFALMASL